VTAQLERSIQSEIMLRLRAGAYPVLALPIPNGIYIPTRSEAEKDLVRRIVARMKSDGLLLPGALDLSFHWHGGGGIMDIKRPASKDLFGHKKPAGRPSDDQKELVKRAEALGINYAFVHSWDETRDKLREWGAI
jgi:hypothetical protein